jgi:hypothetical protein
LFGWLFWRVLMVMAVAQRDAGDGKFMLRLVEDRGAQMMSYMDFLCRIYNEIQKRMS